MKEKETFNMPLWLGVGAMGVGGAWLLGGGKKGGSLDGCTQGLTCIKPAAVVIGDTVAMRLRGAALVTLVPACVHLVVSLSFSARCGPGHGAAQPPQAP